MLLKKKKNTSEFSRQSLTRQRIEMDLCLQSANEVSSCWRYFEFYSTISERAPPTKFLSRAEMMILFTIMA